MHLRSILLVATLLSGLVLCACKTTSSGSGAVAESDFAPDDRLFDVSGRTDESPASVDDDDFMVVEPADGSTANDAAQVADRMTSTASSEALAAEGAESPVRDAEEASGGWLPWGKEKRKKESALQRKLAELEAERRPRISEPKVRKTTGGDVGNDTGLSASELGRWEIDPRRAMKDAREQRRMLLVWMTNSKGVAPSRSMAIELFRHTQFLTMARDAMNLARIDFGDTNIASHPFTREWKANLKVNGYPTLILFSPDGQEIWRFTGYRAGRYALILDQLRALVEKHHRSEEVRLTNLRRAGYRDWTNPVTDTTVFAKAVSLSREEKTVTLLLPDGKRYPYSVLKLSEADRNWLAEAYPKPD